MAKYINAEDLRTALLQKSFYPAIVAYELENMPAADVVEVKHGYWKPTGRKLTCSVCGHRTYIGTDDVAILMEEAALSKYCFHCGAKMDSERKADK